MQLGPYRVLRPFAEDSLGETFLAMDGDLQLLVRVLGPALVADPQVNDRLTALMPTQVELPGQVHSRVGGVVRQADGSALWVMLLPAGHLLADLLTQPAGLAERRGPGSFVPLPGALPIAQRLAELLAAAHASGTSHLRLSPDQVFVALSADKKPSVTVVLRDVGLWAALGPGAIAAAKNSARAAAYLAPEQRAAGAQALGAAPSDVYALGVLLVQLLTGQLPGQPQWSAALAHLKTSAVPMGVSSLIESMLAPEPHQRPRMKQVESALRLAAQVAGDLPLPSQMLAYEGTLAGGTETAPPPLQSPDAAAAPVISVRNEPVNGLMGNFRLVRKLGEGGMGVVYEAEHQKIGRRAAVKVLHNEFAHSPDFAKRFLNEARAVNIIRHPGLVEIFEYGQQPDGTLYIVMEFLEGESLHKRIQTPGTRLAPEKVAELGVQLARALATAHEKGIIHRDLKPENIMLVPDPVHAGQERVKILDFGIAKLQHVSSQDPSLSPHGKTALGSVMGTPLYMAPEQFGRAESVDGSADVFALGVILYELLAGRRPYEGESLNVLSRPSGPIHKVNPSTPPRIAELIMEMISPSAPQRPTMRQVAERLAPFTQTGQSRPSPLRYVLLGSIAAVVVLTLLFVLFQRRPALTPAEARQVALAAIQAGLHSKAKAERLLAVQALGTSRDPTQSDLITPLLADSEVVGAAARALGNLGAVAAQPALLALVEKAPDNQVRLEAATALAQLAHASGTTSLRALLGQPDGVIQVEAALRLLEQNDLTGSALLHRLADNNSAPLPRVLPVLAALARAGDDAARQRLAQLAADPQNKDPLLLYTLAQGGDAAATSRLSELAQNAGPEQVLAARFVASLGQDVGYEVLLQKAGDTKQPDAVREIAIEGLGDRGRFDAAAPLAAVVQGAESRRLRLTAAGAILRLAAGEPSRRAEQSLSWSRVALGSDSAAMRELAVGLLGNVESDTAVLPLRQALRDREREVRYHAVKALGRRHVRAALEALGDALDDADSEVRTAGMRSIGQVITALRHLGDNDADQLVQQQLQKLARGGEEIDRVVASGILLQTGDTAQQAALRDGLHSHSALVRRLAIEMMLQDVPLLSGGLNDPDRLVRLAAARRLVGVGSAEVKAVLRELATGSDEAALSAYGLLRRLGETVAEPPKLTAQLKKGTVRERTALVELLPELPPALALRLLVLASIDESPVVRQRAAEAAYDLLAKTGQPEFSRVLFGMRSDSALAVRLAVAELVSRLPKIPLAAPSKAAPQIDSPPPAAEPNPAPPEPGAAPPAPAPVATGPSKVETKVQDLLTEVRAAIRSKKYSRAQSGLNRARKMLRHKGGKTVLPSEILYLQGTVYEQSGKWRQAMETYSRYDEVPAALRVAESAQQVTTAVARLKTRMGKVQIYTLAGGKCQVTEEYYLPAGDHIISLGGGQTKTVSVDVGATTPVRQCQ